jgi:hypothetical protein
MFKKGVFYAMVAIQKKADSSSEHVGMISMPHAALERKHDTQHNERRQRIQGHNLQHPHSYGHLLVVQ